MPILNYTTKINANKTLSELTQILAEHGANKIVVDYKDGMPVEITFRLFHLDRPIYFALPCNWEGVLKVMKTQKGVEKRFCNKEQAIRTSWRIIKVWVEAQMSMIDAELVSAVQVFLPYAITKNGSTLYNLLDSENQLTNALISNE